MNYHDWAKNASPYANALSPEITCSTCTQCKTEYQRDDNKYQFNPLYCPFCMGKNMMAAQFATAGDYNAPNAGLNNSMQDIGQFTDSPYGGFLGAVSRYFNG